MPVIMRPISTLIYMPVLCRCGSDHRRKLGL